MSNILLIFFALVAGIGFSFLLYGRKGQPDVYPRSVWMGLWVLRALAGALMVLLLLGPVFYLLVKEVEKPVVVLLADNSQSLLLSKDSTQVKAVFNQEWEKLATTLAEDYEVHVLRFDEKVVRDKTLNYTGLETDISHALSDISVRFANRNLAALVLASDGILTKGADPLYAEGWAGVPVYTVRMGDTTLQRDARVSRLRFNEVVFSGNTFPLEVTVEAEKLSGERLRLQLTAPDGSMQETTLEVKSQRQTFTHTFTLKAGAPGTRPYQVTILPVKDEPSKVNNRKTAWIEVVDNRRKILLASSAPHPDLGAIRQALEANEQLEVLVQTGFEDQLPVPAKELSLAILIQLPSRSNSFKQVEATLAAAQVPTWYILGQQTDLLTFNQWQTGLKIERPVAKLDEVQGIWNRNFSFFQVSDVFEGWMQRFPPLHMPFGDYKVAAGAQALVFRAVGGTSTGIPLWLFFEGQGRRTSVLAGEGIWKWRMASYERSGNHETFDGLMRGVVQFLALREDKSLFRVHGETRYREGVPVVFLAELYNEALEPIQGPEVHMQISDADQRKFNFVFTRLDRGYRLDAGSFAAGAYQWQARVVSGGKTYEKSGMFTVEAIQSEALVLQANHDLLTQMALQSGAQSVDWSQMALISEMLEARTDVQSILRSHQALQELIDWKWTLMLLFVLLGAEWGLRKYFGQV